MRAIDADALRRKIQQIAFHGNGGILTVQAINEAPTLEVEPVRHGKWLEREDDYNQYTFCSECGEEYIEDNELGLASWVKQYFKYCPYCGAKMDERKEE